MSVEYSLSRNVSERQLHRGDTLIEVMMSFAIFSVVVLIAINSMNSGISAAEASLELTLARSEINSQGEAIRFIHNSFLNDRELQRNNQEYLYIWAYLRGLAIKNDSDYPKVYSLATKGCDKLFDQAATEAQDSIYKVGGGSDGKAFIMNTRNIIPSITPTAKDTGYYQTIVRATTNISSIYNKNNLFTISSLNPRIIYRNNSGQDTDGELYQSSGSSYNMIGQVEGLWDIVVEGEKYDNTTKMPGYYDFHLNACWNAPGKSVPTTLSTIIRLYNPEYMEKEITDGK